MIKKKEDKFHYIKEGNGEPLLFLHGFGYNPEVYHKFLTTLSKKYEVIAPRIYGINEFSPQPTTLEHYLDLTNKFTDKIKLKEHHLAGHSMGAGIAMHYANTSNLPQDLTLISPIQPIEYNPLSFITKAFNMNLKQITGLIENKNEIKESRKHSTKNIIPYIKNIIKKPNKTFQTISNLSKFSYNELNIKISTLVLFSKKDEFFTTKKENIEEISSHFKKISYHIIPGNHERIIYSPSDFVEKLIPFLKSF